ncbi:tripartite tricarboxylate transporter substrate binding protein [Jannaschia formosa]|uniref:tripartite tricarboxylate transporter substrate binding protein n=1 Tax=Jannaschia formosa TaxID=2259592 RepID=UPI000E1BAFBC|nr:tripartite tricarboxylate transporter substrate binding protein [Jannaschia formosa]TFL16360.1 tripartite tricarboxylate transporter substrate binding protein [Jannaschia formosa]
MFDRLNTLTRRAFGAAALAALATAAPVAAQDYSDYPSKPITVMVGWNAGGGSDIFARIVAKYAEEYLGAPFVIVNKPGGGGQVSLNELVTRTEPDGYTLAVAIAPNMIYQPQLRPEGQDGYQFDQLVQIGTPVRVPSGFMVPNDSQFETFDDLVAYAKENPGKVLVGMNGARSGGHGLLLMIEKEAGVDFTEVSYPGGSKQVQAALGGEVHVLNTNAMHQVSYVDQLRPLGFAGENRYALAPDAPTFREQGYEIIDYVTRGLVAPPGTPEPIVEHLREGMLEMSMDPEFKEDLAKAGLALDFMDADAVKTYVDNFTKNQAWVFDIFREQG